MSFGCAAQLFPESNKQLYINRQLIPKLKPEYYHNIEYTFILRSKKTVILDAHEEVFCESEFKILEELEEYSLTIINHSIRGIEINKHNNVNTAIQLKPKFTGPIMFHLKNRTCNNVKISKGDILGTLRILPYHKNVT